MALADRITILIEPVLESMGYELVRVMLSGGKNNQTLQIMAERQDGTAMAVEDCEAISRTVSAQLDVADPIASAYTLEVSSPGLDRPLTRLKDFNRFEGHEAKLQLREAREGQRNFRGILRGVEGDTISLELVAAKKGETNVGRVALPFSEIEHAKLMMTDTLLRQALSASKN
jgi:ribosome maturation factor RimP